MQVVALTPAQVDTIAELCKRPQNNGLAHISKAYGTDVIRVEFGFPYAYRVFPDGHSEDIPFP